MQEKAFEVLRSLPSLGIEPGVEVFNQIFEYYARTHNYKQTKATLRIMSQVRPHPSPLLLSLNLTNDLWSVGPAASEAGRCDLRISDQLLRGQQEASLCAGRLSSDAQAEDQAVAAHLHG